MIRQFNGLIFKKMASIYKLWTPKIMDLIKFHNFNHKNSFGVVNKDTDLQRKIISIYNRAIGRTKRFFYGNIKFLYSHQYFTCRPVVTTIPYAVFTSPPPPKKNELHPRLFVFGQWFVIHTSIKFSISVCYWKYI